jgi:ribosomal protein L40E
MPDQRTVDPVVREEGDLLLVSHGARLADVCLKCAARDGIQRRFEVMRYRRLWPAVGLALSLLGCWYLASLLLTMLFPFDFWRIICGLLCFAIFWRGWRYGALDLPLCRACNARWSGVVRARLLMTLAIIPVLVLSAVAIDLDAHRAALGGHSTQVAFALVTSWFLGLVAVNTGAWRRRTVAAKAIRDQLIFLRGVHPDARRVLVVEAVAAGGVRRIPPKRG